MRLQHMLSHEITPNTTIVDDVRYPCRSAEPIREPHRLGDYFESVRVLPGAHPEPASFRVLFHRRVGAGRFWKDIMVRLLQRIRSEAAPATTTLEYRGDQDPKVLEVGP